MELTDLIKQHEGFRDRPYKCSAGKITIGWGRNLDDVGITEHEALLMLNNDIKKAEDDLQSVFPPDFLFSALTYPRYCVLVDMMFNLGLTRFRGFKKFIAAVNEKDWQTAAHEMLDSKWAKQVKTRAFELARMMEKG